MRNHSIGRHPIKKRQWSWTRIVAMSGFAGAAVLVAQDGIAQGDPLTVLFGCLLAVTLSSCIWMTH